MADNPRASGNAGSGSCWTGDELTITPGVPKDVLGLRKGLIETLKAKMQAGATPYNGPIAAGYDPNRVAANNILAQLMGAGNWGGANLIGSGGMNASGLNPVGDWTDPRVKNNANIPEWPGTASIKGNAVKELPGADRAVGIGNRRYDPYDPTTW